MIEKLKNLIKRAATVSPMKDSGNYPVVQVRYFNRTAEVEVLTPYGFHSSPPRGSLGPLFNIMASEDNRTGIFQDPLNRFSGLKEGEVIAGNYLTRAKIFFKEDGSVELIAKNNHRVEVTNNEQVTIGGNQTVTVNGGLVEYNVSEFRINGKLRVQGDIEWDFGASQNSLNNFRSTYNSHTHEQPSDAGGDAEETTNGPNQTI